MSDLDKLSIDTLRLLAVDAIEQAKNGHPGAPMALSPLAYLLFTKYMVHDPTDFKWTNRDRFRSFKRPRVDAPVRSAVSVGL